MSYDSRDQTLNFLIVNESFNQKCIKPPTTSLENNTRTNTFGRFRRPCPERWRSWQHSLRVQSTHGPGDSALASSVLQPRLERADGPLKRNRGGVIQGQQSSEWYRGRLGSTTGHPGSKGGRRRRRRQQGDKEVIGGRKGHTGVHEVALKVRINNR